MKNKLCVLPYGKETNWKNQLLDVMRKSLILFIIFINVTVFGFSQKVTLNMKNTSIHEVLNTLTNKTGVDFFYNYDVFDAEKLVDINVKNLDLLHVVSQIAGNKYQVKFVDNKLMVIVPVSKSNQQQEYELSGIVTDEFGKPLEGVTVLEKSKQRWDITREKGDFRISVFASDTITFSFLGYKTLNIPVNGRKNIKVNMTEAITELSEVTIVGSNGYASIPKERATGAFDVISPKSIRETPTIDINARLEGEIPGVNVDVKTGTIAIRGTNNYSGTPPLVVVDGFPMPENDFRFSKGRTFQGASVLSYLNPDDIESITVLKDASASAIWGSRAANGVIVITTKSGKKSGEPSISFSSTTTIGNKISLDKLRQMSTAEYVDFEKELVNNGFLVDNSSNWQSKNISEVQEIMFKAQRGEISLAQQDAMLGDISNRSNLNQINKYLLRNSISQQYDFSISGGNDLNTYYISAGYNKDDAVMKANNSNSYFVTVNNSTKLKPFLKLETGVNYVKSNYNENGTANEALSNVSSSSLRPYDMIADANGQGIDKYLMFRPEVIQGFESSGYLPWTYNYLDQLNYSTTNTKGANIRLNAKLTATITDWLNVEASGMYNSIKNNLSTLNELDSYYTRNMINEATSINSSQELVYGIPIGANFYTSYLQNNNQSMRLQLNVNKSFNDQHYLNFLAGAEVREERREGGSRRYYGYDTDSNNSQSINPTEYYTTIYGWQTFIGSSGNSILKYRSRFLSYYGLGSYAYNNKYFVSGSIRLDDYNLLGASRRNRALPLWSTGIRWDIAKEHFLNNVAWLNSLSIRATYGKSGSSPTGGLGNSSSIISVGNTDYNTQLPISSILLPENSKLKWETTKSWNFGLNFGLFNNRLNGDFNLYYKKSEDILTSVPFNPTYGWSYLIFNTATLKGRGVELGLNGIIFKGDFQWKSTLNFSYNTNKVTDSRFEANTTNDYLSGRQVTGKTLSSVYAYKWAGLDANGQSQIYSSTGEIIDSNTSINNVKPEDLKYMGTTQAPYFGGFFNNFSYKNFNLGIRVSYYAGHVFKNIVLQNYPSYQGVYYGNSLSKEAIVADRWRVSGDEATTNVPGLANINYNSLSRFQNADINVLPADNIRLQQVSLGYDFPSKWLKQTFFKSMNISFAARNLGLLWRKNKEGIDPQYLSTNNYNTLPPERNYTLQFNLGF